jgi:hypothetical protein
LIEADQPELKDAPLKIKLIVSSLRSPEVEEHVWAFDVAETTEFRAKRFESAA